MIQMLVMTSILVGLLVLGFSLFRKTMLERYFTEKTGYVCEVESFDFDPWVSLVELHNLKIYNKEPFPNIPLGEIRCIRLEWDPSEIRYFPKHLRLLEIEIQSLTLIRLEGNQFNILDFVEDIVSVWGNKSDVSQLRIDECWVSWDYIVTLDDEHRNKKRMELLLEYEGFHQNVTSIREITDPPMALAKGEVDGFYFFNYITDSVKGLLK